MILLNLFPNRVESINLFSFLYFLYTSLICSTKQQMIKEGIYNDILTEEYVENLIGYQFME